jgi:hypothetical protein
MIKKSQNRLRAIWFFLEKYKVYFGFLIGLAILSGLLESLNVALMYPIISEGLDISTSSNVFLNAIEPIMRLIPIKDLCRHCRLSRKNRLLLFICQVRIQSRR